MSFPDLRHFVASEFKYPDLMDETTLKQLDSMRDTLNDMIITINSDYRPGSKGWHGRGKAVDCVIRYRDTRQPVPIVKQFIIASRFLWGGIGFYPYWKDPGLHLDTRPMFRFDRRALWWRDQHGTYHYSVEDDILRHLIAGHWR